MDLAQVLRNRQPAIRMAGCHRRVDMLRRGFRGNLVEMNHAAAASRQFVDVQFDPLHNGLDGSIQKELRIDTGGYGGIVRIGKCLYPFRSDLIQVRIQHTQCAGAAAEFLGKEAFDVPAFGIPPVAPRHQLVPQSGAQPFRVGHDIFIHHIERDQRWRGPGVAAVHEQLRHADCVSHGFEVGNEDLVTEKTKEAMREIRPQIHILDKIFISPDVCRETEGGGKIGPLQPAGHLR